MKSILLLTLLAFPANALTARLLPELTTAGGMAVLLPPDAPMAEGASSSAPREVIAAVSAPSYVSQAGVGAFAAAISVPASLGLAAWVGTWSNNLFLAALPSLLLMLALPAIATAWAVTWFGNRSAPDQFRFWPALGAAVLIQAAVLVMAGFAGVSVGVPLKLLFFCVFDALALGTGTAGTSQFFRRAPTAAMAVSSPDPRVPSTQSLKVAEVSF